MNKKSVAEIKIAAAIYEQTKLHKMKAKVWLKSFLPYSVVPYTT